MTLLKAKTSSQQQSVVKRVRQTVLRHKRHFEEHSNLFKHGKQQVLAISWDNVVLGRILGQGGFSDVHEVVVRRPDVGDTKKGIDSDASTTTTDTYCSEETSVPAAAASFVDETTSYALKHLKPSTIAQEKTLRMGVVDLFYEGIILSQICHENIVSLHAVSHPEAYLDGGHGCFIVIDLLQETLSERIREWRCRETHKTRSRSIFRRRSSSKQSQEHHRGLYRRLDTVALPVARAMKYLHEHRILFRDLKPSNIGFTQDGTVKLFDFGLAREIVNPSRRMTGNTGSARYMSPEVARREHYGLPADVYSFGVLLWELCSLEKPYDGMSRFLFNKVIVCGGKRPDVNSAWSEDLQSLIQDCWDKNPRHRPEFDGVCESLQKITTKDDWLSVSRHKMSWLRIRNKPKDDATFEDALSYNVL